MQTFICLFDVSILNFMLALGDADSAVFNGLIGGIIEYIFGLICGKFVMSIIVLN